MRNIKFVLFLLFVFTFYLLPLSSLVYAQIDANDQFPVNPASPFYFLKSAKEVLDLKFAKTSQEKGLKYFEFAVRRIKEAESLINTNRSELIPPVLERYWLNLSKSLGLLNLRDDSLASQVIEEIRQHILTLETLQNQTENQKAKRAIRAGVYRISSWNNALLERLTVQAKAQLSLKIEENHNLICSFLSKEASSSALNQTEKAVLLERAQKCLGQSP